MDENTKSKEPVFLVRPDELKDPAARKKFVKSFAGEIIAMVNTRRKANGLDPVKE